MQIAFSSEEACTQDLYDSTVNMNSRVADGINNEPILDGVKPDANLSMLFDTSWMAISATSSSVVATTMVDGVV